MIAVAGSAAIAAADSAASEQLVHDAESYAAHGDFPAAAAKYRDAYREAPRAELMCNVGVAYYKAKDLPRAHRYLDQCVATGSSLDHDFIANVKTVLAAVEDKLASGDFKALDFIIQPQSATTTFANGIHDEALVGSRQVWVPFGAYRVTIHAEGYTDRTLEITADNRARGEYTVKLEPGAAVTPLPKDTPPAVPLPEAPPPEPPPPEPRKHNIVAPLIASAATGAFGGLALGFYLAARSSASDANAKGIPSAEYADAVATTDTRQHISWVLGGVAGVAAITATVLWVRAIRSPSPVDVSLSHNSAGLSFSGRW